MKKFDKEYSTQWALEYLYLKESGIPFTFVINENGINTWKYKKTYELFNALAKFYKQRELNNE